MKLIELRQRLDEQGLWVFSPQEFRRAAALTPASAKFLLIRYVKRGYFQSFRQGLYGLADRLPSPFRLANRLYRPSYISLESAMAHHGLLQESVYAVTSLTTKTTRVFESMGMRFSYQKVKPAAFTGYHPVTIGGQTVLLALPEKALADYLYFAHLKGRPVRDRIRWSSVRKKKILYFLKLFERRRLLEWASHVIP